MILTKAQLLATLKDIQSEIEADDSYEGTLSYEARDLHEFSVEASYRTGNSMGQGGIALIERKEDE